MYAASYLCSNCVLLQLFHMLLKKAKISFGDEAHAMMVDPFVPLLVKALTSEDVPVIIESLICLTFVVKFKGQSLAAAFSFSACISLRNIFCCSKM